MRKFLVCGHDHEFEHSNAIRFFKIYNSNLYIYYDQSPVNYIYNLFGDFITNTCLLSCYCSIFQDKLLHFNNYQRPSVSIKNLNSNSTIQFSITQIILDVIISPIDEIIILCLDPILYRGFYLIKYYTFSGSSKHMFKINKYKYPQRIHNMKLLPTGELFVNFGETIFIYK